MERCVYELKQLGGEAFFKANIKHTDVKKLNIKFKFLSDIIEAWAKFNYKELLQKMNRFQNKYYGIILTLKINMTHYFIINGSIRE